MSKVLIVSNQLNIEEEEVVDEDKLTGFLYESIQSVHWILTHIMVQADSFWDE